jgi:hypothetical protein
MGCVQSTPTAGGKREASRTTSAHEHQKDRTKDSSQRGPTLFVGEHFTQVKHLGPLIDVASFPVTWWHPRRVDHVLTVYTS